MGQQFPNHPERVSNMYKTTRSTPTLATLGAGAVVSLVLLFPAAAAEGDGPPPGVDVGAAKHGGIEAPSLTPAPSGVDVGAAKHGGIEAPSRVDVGRMLNDIETGATTETSTSPAPAAADASSLEYDQIALGALGGLALAGISVVVLRHRGGQHTPRLT